MSSAGGGRDEASAAALERELDALYRAPLASFVELRDALARRQRTAGAAEEAKRIKALRKPSAVAWAINRLHLERDGLSAVFAAGGELRRALETGRSPAERRAAMETRRRAVDSAVDGAIALYGETGAAESPELRRRVERTILALATAAPAADAPRPGRLSQELEPPGFEALAGLVLPAEPGPPPDVAPERPARGSSAKPRPPRSPAAGGASGRRRASPAAAAREPSPAPSRSPAPPPRPAATAGSARSHAAQRDPEREREIQQAQRTLDDAEAQLERASTAIEAARARIAEGERALREARAEADRARRELAAARARRDALRRG